MDCVARDDLNIIENLKTRKNLVLYDRPPGMAIKPGVKENEAFLFKLTHLPQEGITPEKYRSVLDMLTPFIATNDNSLKLVLAIGQMGGAFREQLNYLGLYQIRELGGNSSRCSSYVSIANKRVFKVGTSIIQKYESGATDTGIQTFYFLSDMGRQLAWDTISLSGQHPSSDSLMLNNTIATHDSNLEHGAGYADLYSYILGNTYYPSQIEFEKEKTLVYKDGGYLLSDALVKTLCSSSSGRFCQRDFVEVDTGSQHTDTIADKLYGYTTFFALQDAGELDLMELIFLNHPAGVCGSIPFRYRDMSNVGINLNSSDICSIYMLCSMYPTASTTSELYEQLFQDSHFASRIHNLCKNAHNDLQGFRKKMLGKLNNILLMGLGDYSITMLFEMYYDGVLNGASIYNTKYYAFHEKFVKRKGFLLGSTFGRLKKEHPEEFAQLNRMCLNGLSIAVCFGADMYRTYLTLHPHFTGCDLALANVLYDAGILCDDAAGRLSYLPSMQFSCDNGDFRLKNYVSFPGTHNRAICIEDINMDYGSMIRCRMAISSVSWNDGQVILCIICDDVISAYHFLVQHCYRALEAESLASAENCGSGGEPDGSRLPVFIPRSVIIDQMSGFIPEAKPFIFKSLNAYRSLLEAYGGKSDRTFPDYFVGNLTLQEAEKDLMYL